MERSKLLKNSALNFVGQIAPAIAGIIAIRYLSQRLGIERMGFMTIAWSILGYFSVFDFGVSRSLTRAIAEANAEKNDDLVSSYIYNGLALVIGLGIVGGLVLYGTGIVVLSKVLHYSAAIAPEAQLAWNLMAFALPIILISVALRGILEGFQDFLATNVIGTTIGTLTFIGPVLFSKSSHLAVVITVLIGCRLLGVIASAIRIAATHANIRFRLSSMSGSVQASLISYGGWLTLSNVVSPFMVYADRFILGNILGPAKVAYYTMPFDAASRILTIPSAVGNSLFPAVAASYRTNHRALVDSLRSSRVLIFIGITIPIVVISIFSEDILRIWLGADLANHGGMPLRIVGLGIIGNSFASPYFITLQASDRQRITGLCNLIELPCYIALLYFFTRQLGLVGIAAAFSIRTAIDYLVLRHFCLKDMPDTRAELEQWDGWTYLYIGFISSIFLVCFFPTLPIKVLVASLVLIGYAINLQARLKANKVAVVA